MKIFGPLKQKQQTLFICYCFWSAFGVFNIWSSAKFVTGSWESLYLRRNSSSGLYTFILDEIFFFTKCQSINVNLRSSLLLISWSAEPDIRMPPSIPLGEYIDITWSLCLFSFFLNTLTFKNTVKLLKWSCLPLSPFMISAYLKYKYF